MLIPIHNLSGGAVYLVGIREDTQFVFKPGSPGTWVDPTTVTFNQIRMACTQWNATLLGGTVYHLDVSDLGGSPGWVNFWGASGVGVNLGPVGRYYVANDAFGKQGFDPDTDICMPGGSDEDLTYRQVMQRDFAILGGRTTVNPATPTATEVSVDFAYGGVTYWTQVYAASVYGQRNDFDEHV